MSRVTLRDIAEHVGVDRSTVSRVLSNKAAEGGISVELAERILLKARELNYIPNVSARAIRTGRFHCAALLMSTVAGRSYLPSRLLDGIHDELAMEDMHLAVAKVPDAKLNSPDYVPKIMRTLMADGVIINYTHHLPEHLVEIVQQRQLPAVWLNTVRESDAVYPGNLQAAREMTERLIAAGHRRIAYIDLCHGRGSVAAAHFSAADRAAGYSQAMRLAGLPAWVVHPDQDCVDFASEVAFARQFLSRQDRPTALVCYFSIFVPAVLRAAAELGIRVPQDLSIVSFAAENLREHGVTVSAMVEPHYRMGQEAVRVLRSKIKAPLNPVPSRTLDFVWHDMGTCTAPAKQVAS
ncbi:MAG TPA: LacI family DNA-binding transcriptional regulator [Tepidisphaeraceae bacterium]|nr:LacI family DNA-binding transcriptional regulator [Tepidisphaeraceae bacterium]